MPDPAFRVRGEIDSQELQVSPPYVKLQEFLYFLLIQPLIFVPSQPHSTSQQCTGMSLTALLMQDICAHLSFGHQ